MMRKRLTVNLPVDLLEQLRNAAYWSPGTTLASLVERGIRVSVSDVEHTHGGPFPARLGALKGGRPRKQNGGHFPTRLPARRAGPRRFVPIPVRTAPAGRHLEMV